VSIFGNGLTTINGWHSSRSYLDLVPRELSDSDELRLGGQLLSTLTTRMPLDYSQKSNGQSTGSGACDKRISHVIDLRSQQLKTEKGNGGRYLPLLSRIRPHRLGFNASQILSLNCLKEGLKRDSSRAHGKIRHYLACKVFFLGILFPTLVHVTIVSYVIPSEQRLMPTPAAIPKWEIDGGKRNTKLQAI
jgi:hypothetical protein